MGLADEAPPYCHARGETDQHTRTSGAVDATRTTCGGDNDGQGGAMAPHPERALRVRGESPEGDGDGMMVSRSGVGRRGAASGGVNAVGGGERLQEEGAASGMRGASAIENRNRSAGERRPVCGWVG